MEALHELETWPGAARLPSPGELWSALPLTPRCARVVRETRKRIGDILHGRDPERLVVVVGPCSIHDPLAALEYAEALHKVAEETREQLTIVMRAYLEKPRTSVGWKGLINDPRLDGSCDIEAGLTLGRRLLREIGDLGVPCASEFLDPLATPYLSDLVSWAVIGARTSESQTHRELASGLPMPVGFKNGTGGSLEPARDAMIAAQRPHRLVGLDAAGRARVLATPGNADRHLVLRGGRRPNFRAADVQRARALVAPLGIPRPIMVDCSHGNSGRDHTRQAGVARAVLAQVRKGDGGIMGLLIESHLRPGRQSLRPGGVLEYGVSITDACIGWDETEPLLYEAAEAVAASRGGRVHAVRTPGAARG